MCGPGVQSSVADELQISVLPLVDTKADRRVLARVGLVHESIDTTYDLLTRLMARELFFDPVAPPEQRDVMHQVIDSYWKKHRSDFRWDTDLGKFTVSK